VDDENSLMIIFGGFCEGERTNETIVYNMKHNMWQTVKLPEKAKRPCSRSGHGSAYHNGVMYVFGGKDQDSNKLNDLWAFNVKGIYWEKIEPEEGLVPCVRSGFTTSVFDGCFIVFGGILEVTKELNDIWAFSFKQNRWILVQDDPAISPRTIAYRKGTSAKETQGSINTKKQETIQAETPLKHEQSMESARPKSANVRKS
jgi:N-acetylneuraminic acid mutarotase